MSITTIRGAVFASLSAVAAFANVAVAVPAHAAELAPTAAVRFRDLDLASEQGVTALNRRITMAARSVCGDADVRDLAHTALIDRCRRDAIVGAAPRVAAVIASARTGNSYASDAARITVAAR